jgi:hypothetical protein
VFADPDAYANVERGEAWTIEGAREAVASGALALTAASDAGRDVALELELSPAERKIVLAGGLVRLARGGGVERVQGETAPAG